MSNSLPKKNVIARMTIRFTDSASRVIVEVQEGATFSSFYTFFRQEGNRRSTKRQVRTANRNEGLPVVNAHRHEPGLSAIANRLRSFKNNIADVQIRILKKRRYRQLLHTAPDVLGMVKANSFRDLRLMPSARISFVLPVGYVNPVRRRELAKIGVR